MFYKFVNPPANQLGLFKAGRDYNNKNNNKNNNNYAYYRARTLLTF